MKILIIGPGKLNYMPYVHLYLDNIDCAKNDVHLVTWNRDLAPQTAEGFENVTIHEFLKRQESEVPVWKKANSFIKYRKFVKKIIKSQNFDYLIVLHSIPGFLTYDIIRKKFAGRYIFDYRDATYERFGIFQRTVNGLCEGAEAVFVSSEGFKKYLPCDEAGDKIYIAHNILKDSLGHSGNFRKNDSGKIRIGHWGFIRDASANTELIKRLKDDDDFELHYYGREESEASEIKKYCEDNGVSNVYFHGAYKPCDRYGFAETTDIIHNVFSEPNMKIAMSNKYYDGLVFGIPQLCLKGSLMGDKVTASGVGLALDLSDENLPGKIKEYYRSIDAGKFNSDKNKALSDVLNEYNACEEKIKSIFA